MRRALVIFLIFLFPLHVFSESVDGPMAMHADTSDNFISSVTASADIEYQTVLDLAAAYEHHSDEPPASADLNDFLLACVLPESASCLACSTPACIPLPEYVLFLPILKPPPLA